jgi:peroxiredoxin
MSSNHVCFWSVKLPALMATSGFWLVFTGLPSVAVEPVELQPVVLQMLRNDSVFNELKLSDDERVQVQAVLDRVDGDWWRSRNQQEAPRIATVSQLTSQVKAELKEILSAESFSRLQQLERQGLGTRMFLADDVASTLGLSPATVQKIASIAQDTTTKVAEIRKRAQAGEKTALLDAEQKRLVKKEQAGIVSLLTNGQKNRIVELTGAPFPFALLQRNLPRAPELTQTAEQWLQGTPTSLAQLRGKVVAVHFYAYQCINCQRNLPHYSAWHKDYEDQGLVVIGIQTPETSRERDPALVAAAATQAAITYPLLMDAASENWKQWGTTMWPSVYLIDRQGYIRTWWQGEMNWQGNPGEQQMRGYLETLLKETP